MRSAALLEAAPTIALVLYVALQLVAYRYWPAEAPEPIAIAAATVIVALACLSLPAGLGAVVLRRYGIALMAVCARLVALAALVWLLNRDASCVVLRGCDASTGLVAVLTWSILLAAPIASAVYLFMSMKMRATSVSDS